MPLAHEYLFTSKKNDMEKLKQMKDVGDTLLQLHKKMIVHRDLKPGNLLFYKGRVCISDFGLVWNTIEDEHITGANEVLGPAAIRPPEFDNAVE